MSTYLKLGLLVLTVGACLAVVVSDGVLPVAAQETYGISGRVINDLNGNGAADPGEPGVEGWRVVLARLVWQEARDVDIAETLSGPEGVYRFSNLAPGSYRVRLPCDGQPVAQWVSTSSGLKLASPLYVGPSSTESGVDFLVEVPAEPIRTDGKITGSVVDDVDMDGTADRREPGLAGWRVLISREAPRNFCSDASLPAFFYVTTDADGAFRAEGLVEGTYRIGGVMAIEPPRDGQTKVKHWALTAPVQVLTEPGAVDVLQANPVKVTLTKDKMKASVGDTLITLLDGSGSISGAMFRDLNGNLIRDENEPPAYSAITGLIRVEGRRLLVVYPPSFQPEPGGSYKFEGLAPGKYMVLAYVLVSGFANTEFRLGPFDVGKGETVADLPFPPLPPTPTPTPRPAAPLPPTPRVGAPITGSGGAPPDGDLAGLATALAVAGVLAVASALVLHRRRTRVRRARRPASE